MTILDRYLLRQFLQIFVICFLSLAGLYIVIDAFGHLDDFSNYAEKHGSLLEVLGAYYAYQSFDIFDRTSGILAMLAAMFTITWLQKHQEMTAMMAAGLSKIRIVKPIIVAAVVISLLSALNREFVIPEIREELARDKKDLGGVQARLLEARYDGATDILISGDKILVNERQIIAPTFILPTSIAEHGKKFVAEVALHCQATEDHPAGFLLQRVSAPPNVDNLPSLGQRDRKVLITAKDAKWLKSGEVFIVSQLSFDLLANGSGWRRYASIRELIQELNQPSTELGADIRVAVHTRILQPFTDCTMLLLGLPLMLSRSNRNVFLSIGICMVAAVSFSLIILTCQSMGGLSLIRPTLAAWLPLMLFVPVAVATSYSFRT